ncbi:hypothetical protein H8D59_01640 [bacterium]|nr:hypothetical protein [bacterium]
MCDPISFREMEEKATQDPFKAVIIASKRAKIVQHNRFLADSEARQDLIEDPEIFVHQVELSAEDMEKMNIEKKETTVALNNLLNGQIKIIEDDSK